MKVGDLVESRVYDPAGRGSIGLVMETEEDGQGIPGHWVEYFEDPGNWKWYSSRDGRDVEVISECR